MPPSNAELLAVLRASLCDRSPQGSLVELDRAPSAYASTSPLEELRLHWANGTTAEIVFKDLNPCSVPESRRHAKPRFLTDPRREIDAYRQWSTVPRFSMSAYCGDWVDRRRDQYWLFLQKLPGDELYKIGDFEAWKEVARWLARMHGGGGVHPGDASRSNRWIRYDVDYFRRWAPRALENCRCAASSTSSQRKDLSALVTNYETVVARLAGLPVTFVHGDFYASNVLIAWTTTCRRVYPVDWEMAGIGSGLLDLAALISGWAAAQQEQLALSYFDALDEEARAGYGSWTTYLETLNDCRLHLALQWLGWSRDWSPPPQHAHDWFDEALQLGEKVGCL